MVFACIGSRETPDDVLFRLKALGKAFVWAGHLIVSGNCAGPDQAFARGGNSVDETKVSLFVPWCGYEAQAIHPANMVFVLDFMDVARVQAAAEIGQALHPAWHRLSLAARRMHTRNVLLVQEADRVYGYLNHEKLGKGGTGMGFRVAKHLSIPTWDLSDPNVLHEVEKEFGTYAFT